MYEQFRIVRPCHSSGGLSPASHSGGPGSSTGQVMWDLWWIKWHWGRFYPSTLVSPANSHSTDCSTLIYRSGLVQYASYWPTYQVGSVSTHPQETKKKVLILTQPSSTSLLVCQCRKTAGIPQSLQRLTTCSTVRVRFASKPRFSLPHSIQTGFRAHPTSYQIGTGGSFSGYEAVGAWIWPLTSIQCRGQQWWSYCFHRGNFAFFLYLVSVE
jgi:hypothetical protein